ncbi:Hsp70 family protein [Arthrobacter sp. MDT2-16]
MTDSGWRLAIDFGTSNTAASVADADGRTLALRLGARSDAITSAVGVYNGEILAGDAATQVAAIVPAAFEPTPKRRLGEDAIVLGDDVVSPVDLVAAVLRHVLNQAVRYFGGSSPAQVVLTHPETWGPYMTQRLMASAVSAGIPEQRIVLLSEPVAAAWHYTTTSAIQTEAHLAVLDFGGGTCDAAVLKLSATETGPSFEVVASGGIDPLGGDDFDAQLEQWVYAQLAAEGKTSILQGVATDRAAANRTALRHQVQEAKHALSFHGSAPIGVRSDDDEWVCTITRREFEQLVEGNVDRAVKLVQNVISQALPSMDDLHRVYLTGGSSYLPALQFKLSELLPLKLGLMEDPKQVTSLGALQAPAPKDLPDGSGEGQAPKGGELSNAGSHAGAPSRLVADPSGSSPMQSAQSPASDAQRSEKSRKKIIIGGTAALAVVVASIAAINAQTGGDSGTEPSAAAQACDTDSQASLSAEECSLLYEYEPLPFLLAPESCRHNPDAQGAQTSIVCDPATSSGFSLALQPRIYVYGFGSAEALESSFQADIENSGAAKGPVNQPPAWENWTLEGEDTTAQGQLLSSASPDFSTLQWSDDKALVKVRAQSAATIDMLYSWWQQKWRLGQ